MELVRISYLIINFQLLINNYVKNDEIYEKTFIFDKFCEKSLFFTFYHKLKIKFLLNSFFYNSF